MEKLSYVQPQVEVLEIAVEQGLLVTSAAPGNSDVEQW